MLERPDVHDDLLLDGLRRGWMLQAEQVEFLPLGADSGTAVFHAVTGDGRSYFIKLRRTFNPAALRLAQWLLAAGCTAVLAPLETVSGAGWLALDGWTMLVYPFVDGADAGQVGLSASQRAALGAALRAIHQARPPQTQLDQLPREDFDGRFRSQVRRFQALVERQAFADPSAACLAALMRRQRAEIDRVTRRAEDLARQLADQAAPHDWVICHTDLHAWNLLVAGDGRLFIVEWDAPRLAPRECDLMFIGAGIDRLWPSPLETEQFYQAYAAPEAALLPVNRAALAYYRYERIVQDFAAFGEQLLLSDAGGMDRPQAVEYFASNFAPGGTIACADQVD
ncbi:MAG: phosphotransferase [Chloroflexota bacterium]